MTQAQRIEGLAVARRHYEADMLVQKTYGLDGPGFRGCSVGCFLHAIYPDMTAESIRDLGDKHRLVADSFGYPEWLVWLQDVIFEGLPVGERERWHVQLFEVLAELPDDYDWKRARHRTHASILRVALRVAGDAREVVQRVLDLHERAARGDYVSDKEWSAARSAARLAMRPAARLARRPAEWSAMGLAEWSASHWSAVRSAANAAARAANAAARAADSAGGSAAYQEIRDGVLAALINNGEAP